jgi:hypothetical protein
VNCREFQERITEAVDRTLGEEEMDMFVDHANKCPPCRSAFDEEVSTKTLVQKRVRMVRTPSSVAGAIMDGMHREDSAPLLPRLWHSIFSRPSVASAIGFAIACAVVIIVLNTPSGLPEAASRAEAGGDVILQSLSNYHAVLSGSIKPQLVSAEPAAVRSFFEGKTEFPVLVPAMKECTLVGSVLDSYGGASLAHVVYRYGDQIIYVYQVCWETVQRGEKLRLPARVQNELKATGWHSDIAMDGDCIVLWTSGSTLCAAVAHMSKNDLVAHLSGVEGSARDAW